MFFCGIQIMPKRMLRDWTDSIPVNTLSVHAERFFVRLIMKADDYGRFHASPKLIRSFLFPLLVDTIRDTDCTRWLAECEKAGLLRCYQDAAGKPLLEIVNFGQRMRESRPKFPSPPDDCRNSPQLAATSGNSPPEAGKEMEAGSGKRELEARAAPPGFSKPSIAEVRDYCRERSNSVDPEAFVDFYESKGWKVGKESMKDWKACVRTWEKRQPQARVNGNGQHDPRGNFAALDEHRRRKAALFGDDHEATTAS